jgi:ubiquitin-protein ligase
MVLIYKIQRGTINLVNNNLAQIILESKTQLKIFEEIEQVHSSPPLYCSIGHYGGSPIVCECLLVGPPETPYYNKKLTVELTIFEGYPYHHPELRIMSNRIYHINFMNQLMGFSRVLHFHQLWQPDWNINRLLQHLIDLLRQPSVELLPEPFQEIYYEWENELAMRKEKQLETVSEKTLLNIEDLSNERVMKMISKLNRIEQMHLQIVFLYLTNYELFCQQIQKLLPSC